ncbi:MAG: diacylglycerol kinase [Schleiferilactobacillus perolens]|uniref:hypothetical protein n=1 Tax=Schleiferilactobacillus perolens TaxID=100468 RepID=UPI0007111896|nr:hypothetical protein [Schleiferilactobacillus perolens]MCI1891107.1 diacylglycerol kinase [Schleiferilactobacillus harbinensis]MCI1911971.1 diacylglycerol kinase [Schleiferilactobacillus harbinensis]
MLYWAVMFFAFLLLLAGTQFLLGWLKQRHIHINRWLFGVAAFLVVIIPHVLMRNVPLALDSVLYLLCAVFGIAFMTETHSKMLKYEKDHPFTPGNK